MPKANAPKKGSREIEGLTIHPVDRIEEALEVVRSLDDAELRTATAACGHDNPGMNLQKISCPSWAWSSWRRPGALTAGPASPWRSTGIVMWVLLHFTRMMQVLQARRQPPDRLRATAP